MKWIVRHLLCCCVFFSSGLIAAGTVDYLQVDNDVVVFSTTASKTGESPGCVSSENANLWSVSLANETGRAMYSLILTAMAKGESTELAVESANDCAVRAQVERADKINIRVNGGSFAGASVGVYSNDGKQRVGTLVGIDESGQWRYVASGLNKQYKTYDPIGGINSSQRVYFESADCSGLPHVNFPDLLFMNVGLNSGRYYRSGASGTLRNYQFRSNMNKDGGCVEIDPPKSTNFYPSSEGEDPNCGEYACVLKEE